MSANPYLKAAEIIDWLISIGAKPEFFADREWELRFVELTIEALKKTPHEEVMEQLELFKFNVAAVAKHRGKSRQSIYDHIWKDRKNVKAAA